MSKNIQENGKEIRIANLCVFFLCYKMSPNYDHCYESSTQIETSAVI